MTYESLSFGGAKQPINPLHLHLHTSYISEGPPPRFGSIEEETHLHHY